MADAFDYLNGYLDPLTGSMLANRYQRDPNAPQQPLQYQTAPDTIPLSLDRTPVPDTGQGTWWSNARQAAGDIGTAATGLAERFNKGVANTLGFRQPGGDIFRAEIPVEQGLARVADVATFATGGLASSLFPAAGAYREAARYALPAARAASHDALPMLQSMLADQSGELRLTPAMRKRLEITVPEYGAPESAATRLERPSPEVEPPPGLPTAAGHNSLLFGQQMEPPPLAAPTPPPRVRQEAPTIPAGRDATFGEELRAQHLEREDALPLAGARMPVVPPPHITNEEELNGLVDRYVQDALSGRAGKYWYEQSGRGILEHAGSPEAATPLAGGLARTSPQTDVASNLTHAVTMHNQYMAGDPLRAGRFPNAMGADVERIYRGGEPVTGEKIGPFMGAVAHQWAPDMFPHELVNDIWNMRILEYPGAGGELYKDSPTFGQHNFARIVADRARAKLEELTGEQWLPRQVQASGWTGGKARLEGTPPEAAAFNFNDALRRNYAQLSVESAPGESTGHFPELLTAPWELREQYHNDIQGALRDPETGRDIIAQHLGLLTGRTVDAPGYFKGQANPGSQVPVAAGQAPGGALQGIDPATRELLDTYGRVYGILMRQDAHAYTKPIWTGNVPVGKRSLYDVTVGRALTADETVAIAKAMHAETGSDFFSPIATRDGFRFRNVPDASGVDNGKFVAAANKIMGRDDILPGVETRGRSTASDGNYEPNDWTVNGDGETYRRGLGSTRSPDLQRRAAELLATLGPRVAKVNDHYAKTHGWTQGPQRRFWEEPAYQTFRLDDVPRAPRPGEIRSTAEIGPNWRPLFGPGSILGSLLAAIGGGSALSPDGSQGPGGI